MEDLHYALAWQAELDTRCPGGCGQPRDESNGPDADGTYQAKGFRCHACSTRQYAAEEFQREGGDTKGLFWVTERIVRPST